MPWKPETYLIAMPGGPENRDGYTYRGLGLHLMMSGSPKGRRKPIWSLTHLGTGHSLCQISGDVRTAFPIATEIAEAGEWDFLSPDGYKDRFPTAPDELHRILSKHHGAKRMAGGGTSHEIAREIAMSRP